MLKIRLQRIGRRNNPSYRVIAVDSRFAAKKGKTVELLGSYDAIRKTHALNTERILFRISQGAQLSDTVHNLLVAQKVLEGKKRNALPKRRPLPKKQEQEPTPQAQESETAPEQEETQGEERVAETKEETQAEESTPEKKEETQENEVAPEQTEAPPKQEDTKPSPDNPSDEG